MPFFLADFFPPPPRRRLISPPLCAPYFRFAPGTPTSTIEMPRSTSTRSSVIEIDRLDTKERQRTLGPESNSKRVNYKERGTEIRYHEATRRRYRVVVVAAGCRNSSRINISNGIVLGPVSFATDTSWTVDISRKWFREDSHRQILMLA